MSIVHENDTLSCEFAEANGIHVPALVVLVSYYDVRVLLLIAPFPPTHKAAARERLRNGRANVAIDGAAAPLVGEG